MKKTIEQYSKKAVPVLLFGGRGYEHNVSRLGAASFLKGAERAGVELLPVYIDRSGYFFVFLGGSDEIESIDPKTNGGDLVAAYPVRACGRSGFYTERGFVDVSVAIPLLHGDFGEDGTLQGLLTSLGIRFVGADTVASAVSCDKAFAKAVAMSAGIPTLPFVAVERSEYLQSRDHDELLGDIAYPVFVKPARLGSSVGASCASSKEELEASLAAAFSVSDRVMIEPALLRKRELECAYFCAGERKIISHPAEISVPSGFYDYGSKYSGEGGVTLTVRADIPSEVKEKIVSFTDRLATLLTVSHMARFDYFLSEDGELYFNEVNTMPGMTSGSLYASMLGAEGLTFEEFIGALVSL